MEKTNDKPGFVVKDRRKVSLEDLDRQPDKPKEETETTAQPSEPERTGAQPDENQSVPLPQVSFSTFVFSLSSSALVHLGEVPEPSTGQTRTDLPMAKQIIDTLGMLDEKTKGNLAQDEDKLLKTVLYDLRMRYIQKSSK